MWSWAEIWSKKSGFFLRRSTKQTFAERELFNVNMWKHKSVNENESIGHDIRSKVVQDQLGVVDVEVAVD